MESASTLQRLLTDAFSASFLRSISQTFQIYKRPEEEEYARKFDFNKVAEMIEIEGRRSLARAYKRERVMKSEKEYGKIKNREIEEASNALQAILELTYRNGDDPIQAFINWLAIIEFIERKIHQA